MSGYELPTLKYFNIFLAWKNTTPNLCHLLLKLQLNYINFFIKI